MIGKLISLVLCLAVMAGGFGLFVLAKTFASSSDEPDAAVTAVPTPSVEVIPIELTTVEDQLMLTGSVDAWEDVVLSAETSGRIEWKGVDDGQSVAAGAELVRIDTKTIQAAVDQARAQEALARQEFDRVSSLTKRGVSAERELDTASANLKVAEATLRSGEIQLAKSRIAAPIAGIVDSVMAEADEFVDIGAPLVRLVQVDKVKVVVGIPERDIRYFAEGDAVRVRLDAVPDRTFEGRIHRIATSADALTHTFRTEVAVDNQEGVLRPGMIARTTLVRQSYPDSVMVPIFSTFLLEDKRFAVVVEHDTAQLREVTAGIVQGGMLQVVDGLGPGDLLVVKGQYDVREGEAVKAQEVRL